MKDYPTVSFPKTFKVTVGSCVTTSLTAVPLTTKEYTYNLDAPLKTITIE